MFRSMRILSIIIIVELFLFSETQGDPNEMTCNEVEVENRDSSTVTAASPLSSVTKVAAERFLVKFVNKQERAVSVFWENSSGVASNIVKSISALKSQDLLVYVGQAFFFTVEGTGSRIGDYYFIKSGQHEYILPADAVPVEEQDGTKCADRYPGRCQVYKEKGVCDIHPGWMIVNCPVSCNRCDLLDSRKRCSRKFLNITEEPWMKPGDLNKLFGGLVERTKMYEPTVVSQPPKGPWIIIFDKFLTDLEVDTFLQWGAKLGYERSTDTGPLNARGEAQKIVSKTRTSSNAWCREGCAEDPVVRGVTRRIEEVTKTPSYHFEEFQLLQYTEGQYYKVHHDMAESATMGYGGGPRTLTFFLYLSDVEEGGETRFPMLDINVKPKKGRAILWPSVLNENSYKQDSKTFHEALPVIKGTKYAANHWIHSNDSKKSNLWGCTGSFD
jgi:hypothetical protein